MSSSRLPGKVLMKNRDQSMVAIMVNRRRAAKGIHQIVIATTTNPLDDEIENEGKRLGVEVFRGSESNVLERVVSAGRNYGAEGLVVLTGDCPLIDPRHIETCTERYLQGEVDFVSNSHIRTYPDGMDVQVVSMSSMESALKDSIDDLEKEHSTLHVRRNTPESRMVNILAPNEENFPHFGLTLDEPKDFAVINLILEHFYPRRNFSCREIIDFLNFNPQILSINSGVVRKGDN